MSLFSCKVCKEKDARIALLESFVSELKTQLKPIKTHLIPLVHQEADGVMSGREAVLEILDEQSDEFQKLVEEKNTEISERDRLLSGTY